MKVGDFVVISSCGATQKGKIQSEYLDDFGGRMFKVKTPYGEVDVSEAICELLPKRRK